MPQLQTLSYVGMQLNTEAEELHNHVLFSWTYISTQDLLERAQKRPTPVQIYNRGTQTCLASLL